MYYLGVDDNDDIIYLTLIDKNQNIIERRTLSTSNGSINVKQLYLDKLVYKNIYLTTGLDFSAVLIKKINLNIKSKQALKKALIFQEKSISPIDQKKTITCKAIDTKNKQTTFFIANRENVKKHLANTKKRNLESDQISSAILALARFISFIDKNLKLSLCIHVGNITSCIVLVSNSIPIKAYSIKIGTKDLYANIVKNKKIQNIDFLKLGKTPKLNTIFSQFKSHISKAALSFLQNENIKNIPIIITGKIADFIHLKEAIVNDICDNNISCKEYKNEKLKDLSSYAISLGLAIEGAKKDGVQFRKSEFLFSKHLQRAGKGILLFSITCLVFSFFVNSFTSILINKKNKSLNKEINILCEKEHIDTSLLKRLSTREKINLIENQLDKESKDFKYFRKHIPVSKVLSWLNNHEILTRDNSTQAEINDFKYNLINIQDNKNKPEKIVAKISLQIKITSPDIAKKFQKSLKSADGIVNDKKEINFDLIDDNLYQISFFLKNLTKEESYVY
jgi:hypothetical protein